MANPATALKDVAQTFEVSGAWLSCIVHSDVFQDKLAVRQDVLFHNTLLPIRDKILSLTHLTMDRLLDAVEANAMPLDELRKSAEMGLRAMGMGKSAPGVNLTVNTQNNLYAPADLLARARASIGGPPALPAPVAIMEPAQ